MSTPIWNVIAPRPYTDRNGQSKTAWTQIGIAFPARDGEGFDLQLYYLPVPQHEGQIRICVRPQLDKSQRNERTDNRQTKRRGGPEAPIGSTEADDNVDDIPY